jgi:hypothetical protein
MFSICQLKSRLLQSERKNCESPVFRLKAWRHKNEYAFTMKIGIVDIILIIYWRQYFV